MDAAVIYADMKFPEVASNRSNLGSIRHPDHHRPCPHWHWVVLRVAWAGNIILMVAVIAMGVVVMNTNSQHSENGMKAATYIPDNYQGINRKDERTLEELRSDLRLHLCEATSKENESCHLCPMTWQLHKKKCYWFSTIIQSWNKSKEDCIAKKSQLVVISDQEEKEFIRMNIKQFSWIGLRLVWPEKKWTWVDDSPLNQTLSSPGTLQKNSCGAIKASGIFPEICSTELMWTCQKESILI